MQASPLFATIDLPDNRKIIIRQEMPAEVLKKLLADTEKPGFSVAGIVRDYAEYDVSVKAPHPFKKLLLGQN